MIIWQNWNVAQGDSIIYIANNSLPQYNGAQVLTYNGSIALCKCVC
jgi:hypothetical protein